MLPAKAESEGVATPVGAAIVTGSRLMPSKLAGTADPWRPSPKARYARLYTATPFIQAPPGTVNGLPGAAKRTLPLPAGDSTYNLPVASSTSGCSVPSRRTKLTSPCTGAWLGVARVVVSPSRLLTPAAVKRTFCASTINEASSMVAGQAVTNPPKCSIGTDKYPCSMRPRLQVGAEGQAQGVVGRAGDRRRVSPRGQLAAGGSIDQLDFRYRRSRHRNDHADVAAVAGEGARDRRPRRVQCRGAGMKIWP